MNKVILGVFIALLGSGANAGSVYDRTKTNLNNEQAHEEKTHSSPSLTDNASVAAARLVNKVTQAPGQAAAKASAALNGAACQSILAGNCAVDGKTAARNLVGCSANNMSSIIRCAEKAYAKLTNPGKNRQFNIDFSGFLKELSAEELQSFLDKIKMPIKAKIFSDYKGLDLLAIPEIKAVYDEKVAASHGSKSAAS